MPENIVILDGAGAGDTWMAPAREALAGALEAAGGSVETFRLGEMKLAHCLGCFNCWVKTPGMCVEADEGRTIARAIVRSDTLVLFTPVTFGGYSPEMKKMVDRFVQIASPLFAMFNGETHHPPRYRKLPRIVAVGVQREANEREAQVFRTLAGRNAINFHPPSSATEVVVAGEAFDELRARFAALLARNDALPYNGAAEAMMPAAETGAAREGGARRALLLIGSPKVAEPSTSAALGGYVMDKLKERGWDTETLTLRASLNRPEGERELLDAAGRAGLIVLAFPLYVDSLPYLATKALTILAAPRVAESTPRRLLAIVNSGFPEVRQNAVAMAICREFAAQSGMEWAGGLALGGGGSVGPEPLAGKRSGPPVHHVTKAFDMAVAAIRPRCRFPSGVGSI
jgi:multimeric flavodoxin WrbA